MLLLLFVAAVTPPSPPTSGIIAPQIAGPVAVSSGSPAPAFTATVPEITGPVTVQI